MVEAEARFETFLNLIFHLSSASELAGHDYTGYKRDSTSISSYGSADIRSSSANRIHFNSSSSFFRSTFYRSCI